MNKYLYIFILSMLAATDAEAQSGIEQKDVPKLVVNISIDQLRSDYLEAFMPLYSEGGFKKLINEGVIFTQASYPFLPVDRASASASLATGTTPYYNNIPATEWLSRKSLRPVKSTIHEGSTIAGPEYLSVSTIGDELKITSKGAAKIYAIAPEQDAAILSAGHAADAALWVNTKTGTWTTSAFYQKVSPAWLDAFNRLHAPATKIKSSWKAFNDLTANFSYFMSTGAEKPFSHSFTGTMQYADYTTSALINEDITALAMQCVSSTAMGSDNITDLLSLQYYAGNYRHQSTEDVKLEIQDTYVRLDNTLSDLLEKLEKRIGKDKLMIVLTSTGYTDEGIIDYSSYRLPSGTFYINRTANYLNMYLSAIYGQGRYVEAYKDNQIYLDHKLIEKKQLQLGDVLERSREMLLMSEGIREAHTSIGLLSSNDPEKQLVRNGYCIEASGDIIIEIAPGWKLLNEDNQQQRQWRAACMQFPVIFYGYGLEHNTVNTPVTTDRIAPTICKSIRIRAPNACKSNPLY